MNPRSSDGVCAGAIKLHQPMTEDNTLFTPERMQGAYSNEYDVSGPYSMDAVAYKVNGTQQVKKLIFVAVIAMAHVGNHNGATATNNPFLKSTTIHVADLTDNTCFCDKVACLEKCPLVFKRLPGTITHGVLAMELFPRDESPTHIYFAKFSLVP